MKRYEIRMNHALYVIVEVENKVRVELIVKAMQDWFQDSTITFVALP